MRYAKPKESEALKMLFGWGLLNSNIFFSNNEWKRERQIFEYNLFYSIIVEGK